MFSHPQWWSRYCSEHVRKVWLRMQLFLWRRQHAPLTKKCEMTNVPSVSLIRFLRGRIISRFTQKVFSLKGISSIYNLPTFKQQERYTNIYQCSSPNVTNLCAWRFAASQKNFAGIFLTKLEHFSLLFGNKPSQGRHIPINSQSVLTNRFRVIYESLLL